MSLYPSLEDMKVDRMMKAQLQTESRYATPASEIITANPSAPPAPEYSSSKAPLYPFLGNYMGLELSETVIAQNMPEYATINRQTAELKTDSQYVTPASEALTANVSASPAPTYSYSTDQLYPFLGDYMGLELSETVIAQNMPEYTIANRQIREIIQPVSQIGPLSGMIAPLSGQSQGLQRAQVTNGIRELTLCKDKNGKLGVRVHSVNNGVFVCLVSRDSPAALAGLRFGDQILEINGTSLAGYSMDQVHKLLRKVTNNDIKVVVRDRPFERTITMHKDSLGHIGFLFKNGKIIALVKDSSAARNGLLTDHQLLEINGKNVVGLKDKEITTEIANGGEIITVTVIPSYVYDHMIKKMSGSLLKTSMDHSLPNL